MIAALNDQFSIQVHRFSIYVKTILIHSLSVAFYARYRIQFFYN